MKTLSKRVMGLLFEAYRRHEMTLSSFDLAKPLGQRWLGLGTLAAYRPIIDAGLMTWHDGRTPPPRCMGWLVLTPNGIAAMEEHKEEFAKALERIRSQYAGLGNYMLAYGATG
jgi:hypothetical protein